ncbi:MAG: NAD+ synthase [Gammaproteobacteria bacterium]|nr:NAD+ synthase [Gammaproteobacteria bacterium]
MAQVNLRVGDVAANTQIIIDAAIKARDELGAQVIVFPELTLSGYPPEDLLMRQGLYRQIDAALARICAEVEDIHLFVGHPRRQQNDLYNTVSVIHDGGIVASYDKQCLPNYGVFDEMRYFSAGDSPCVVEVSGVRLGVTICEDIWQTGPALQARDAGAEILLNLNASPFNIGKKEEREVILRQRVAQIGVPVVYVNLVGGQDELVFDGESLVMNRGGRVTQRAPLAVEGLYPVVFQRGDEVEPVAGEIALDLAPEAVIYQLIVLGIRDYVRKNRFPGVVIGLSGGIDSALTLALAVDALGADAVEVVMMPSEYTADMSQQDACQQAQTLGVKYSVIEIANVFHGFLNLLQDEFAGRPVDATEENIQARCRGVILMAIANKNNRVLLTTGNKSEMSVGYATLYGDMAGGFAPIKDLPKMMVYALSRWLNREQEIIPQRVIDRPPSAELAPDQKDEDSLPAYEVLDPILEMYVERDLCVADIIAMGYEASVVNDIATKVDRNEYKRRQAPPGIRITSRAFGRDRRYPLTSGYTNSDNISILSDSD